MVRSKCRTDPNAEAEEDFGTNYIKQRHIKSCMKRLSLQIRELKLFSAGNSRFWSGLQQVLPAPCGCRLLFRENALKENVREQFASSRTRHFKRLPPLFPTNRIFMYAIRLRAGTTIIHPWPLGAPQKSEQIYVAALPASSSFIVAHFNGNPLILCTRRRLFINLFAPNNGLHDVACSNEFRYLLHFIIQCHCSYCFGTHC